LLDVSAVILKEKEVGHDLLFFEVEDIVDDFVFEVKCFTGF